MTQPVNDVFEMDVSKLQNLTLQNHGARKQRVHEQNEHEIRQFLYKHTMLKFALLCRKLNIDPMHPKSIHLVLLLFCKVKNKKDLLLAFSTHPCCAGTPDVHIDWNVLESEKIDISDTFHAMSDWILLLKYLEAAVRSEEADELAKDDLFLHFKTSWQVGGLDSYYPPTIQRMMTALIYMAPSNLSASKMLERLLVGEEGDTCRDLEFRCMKTTSHFMDVPIDETDSMMRLMLVVPLMSAKPTFFTDMKVVLDKEDSMRQAESEANCNTNTRLQMRVFSKQIETHGVTQYTETFDSWLGQQKFTVTTSRHLQMLLYFIQVQTQAVPLEAYSMHYTANMLARATDIKVQHIDPLAVIAVVRSLRVYHHNISSLIDFRATCLGGLNQETRNKLTQAQVLQLYVCAFQHPSIMQQCWKAIVPTWNHTIASALDKFRAVHEFEVTAVIDSLVRCQVQDQSS